LDCFKGILTNFERTGSSVKIDTSLSMYYVTLFLSLRCQEDD